MRILSCVLFVIWPARSHDIHDIGTVEDNVRTGGLFGRNERGAAEAVMRRGGGCSVRTHRQRVQQCRYNTCQAKYARMRTLFRIWLNFRYIRTVVDLHQHAKFYNMKNRRPDKNIHSCLDNSSKVKSAKV